MMIKKIDIISKKEKETFNLGIDISNDISNGDVIGLIGNLASGKTTFVKGILKGLKYKHDVTSPTFSLINEYDANYEVIHIDCYREKNIERWINLGINDYFNGSSIVIVEWPEILEKIIEKEVIKVKINHLDENKREIYFI